MARRYLVRTLPDAGECTLPDDVAHHVGRVLRARPGDELVLFDGDGHEARARVVRTDRRAVVVAIGAARAVRREPPVAVELAVSLPKGARADWLFEHGTEIGVAAFRPVSSARSARIPKGIERFERIVAAATGQCDRSHLPRVREPVTLDELLADPDLPGTRFCAAPGAATELGATSSERVLVAIGPEGGFTGEELARLDAANFARRALGPLTLRVETAALVAAIRLLGPAHGS